MIYFIRCEATGLVKIGYSKNPHKRFLYLKIGSAAPLTLDGIMEGSQADEAALHQRFAANRKRGEWFSVCSELAGIIACAALPERNDDRLTTGALADAAGISKSYASEIISGKRQPSPSLAIKIYRATGHKFPPIAELPDDRIDMLERMLGEVAGMLGSAA